MLADDQLGVVITSVEFKLSKLDVSGQVAGS